MEYWSAGKQMRRNKYDLLPTPETIIQQTSEWGNSAFLANAF